MNRRWVTTTGALAAGWLLLTQAVTACGGGAPGSSGDTAELGALSLPLATHGPSGQKYRLRDATFEIRNPYYYGGYAGEGGSGSQSVLVSSEDDPDADKITVSLEEGYYIVALQPGWRLEKAQGASGSDVEATLLSGESQWVYISPHSTSWAEFHFGVGDRELWLNGDLNLEIQVHEDPDVYYGYGGAGGDNAAGSGGW